MASEGTERAAAGSWAWSLHEAEAWVPWIVSLAAHAMLLIVGFLVVWTVGPMGLEERPPVVVSFDNPAPAPFTPPEAAPVSPAGETGEPLREVSLPEVSTPSLSAVVAAHLPGAAASEPEEKEAASAVMERRLPEVRFAGLGVSNATDIVYVVDGSGSMVSTLPVVMEYLRRSVSRLGRTQRFQVIFYGREDYSAAPHPGDVQEGVPTMRLIRATPENVRQVVEWMSRVIPGGRSNPIPALKRALWLKPDAVFLLSNVITGVGQWEADKATLLKEIDALNPIEARTGRRKTVIKTIQFLEEDPAEILKSIGEIHGGEGGYKFIPRAEQKEP